MTTVTTTETKFATGKIYKLANTIDDKIYIGSTCKELKERLWGHRGLAKQRVKRKVYAHCNAIGWDNIAIELIEQWPCETKEQLTIRERHWCLQLKPMLNSILIKTDAELHETYKQGYLRYSSEHKNEKKAYAVAARAARTPEDILEDNKRSNEWVKAHPDKPEAICKKYNSCVWLWWCVENTIATCSH